METDLLSQTAADPWAPQDPWVLAGRELSSRLILGTGGVQSLDVLKRVLDASGAALTTVAMRRVLPAGDGEGSLLARCSRPAPASCRTRQAATPRARRCSWPGSGGRRWGPTGSS